MLERFPAWFGDETQRVRLRGESDIAVVVSQEKTMFCPTGEHAIGLGGTFRDEIVHENTEIGIGTGENQGRFSDELEGGIGSGEEPLPCGFFVAGGAVDLSGEVQVGDAFGFEGGMQLGGRTVVVFDGVARAKNLDILEAGNGPEKCVLDLHG